MPRGSDIRAGSAVAPHAAITSAIEPGSRAQLKWRRQRLPFLLADVLAG